MVTVRYRLLPRVRLLLATLLLVPTLLTVTFAADVPPLPDEAQSVVRSPLLGAVRAILTRLEQQPEFRIAGEQVFMLPEVQQIYRQRDYRPIWDTDDITGRQRIRRALATLESSRSNGLCEADYHLPFFDDLQRRFSLADKPLLLPQLRWSGWYDILLTDALFHYARHLTTGRVPVEALQEGWNLKRQQVDLLPLVASGFENGSLDRLLQGFEPRQPGYRALQQALQRYREIEAFGGWPSLPDGETLRIGVADPRVGLLRTRLLLSGDLPDLPPDDTLQMTAADVAALKTFQKRYGLTPDGVLGEQTLAALNVPVGERVRQIELNMERWRWLPGNLGRHYLLVNIADFRASVVEDGKTVLTMPAIVGKLYRKTPVFSAWLSYLEFAPYWYVPPTILDEDKLPLLKADPSYLERHHFEIVSWDKQRLIDPQSIDWQKVDVESFPGMLRQKSGPWNPLGRVKFMLPNRYAIYLHDTNEPWLFDKPNRQFSSGCIRLQKPAALANYLLQDQGWTPQQVDAVMNGGVPLRVDLANPLPVHVLYWTAWVDDDGRVNFREDVYGRDAELQRALDSVASGCRLHAAGSDDGLTFRK